MRLRGITYSGYLLALVGACAYVSPSLVSVVELAAALAELASSESGAFINLDLTSIADFEDGLMVLLDVYSFVGQDAAGVLDLCVEPSTSMGQMAALLVR
jgi:hypothetical protein